MRVLRNVAVSVRSQAYFILGLIALWWFSAFYRDSLFGFDSVPWMAVGFLIPIVSAIFSVILSISYRRANQSHKWLVRLTLFAAASPWIFFLIMFASSM